MIKFIKSKIAYLVDSRKYDWAWEAVNDTYFGYYLRKVLLKIMGVHEDAAIRDVVSKSRDFVLKMTRPDDVENAFNVLIIQIPLPFNRKNKRILPLGIASLAAYLRKNQPEINVGILDAQCQNMTRQDILEKISEQRWDIIGISYWSVQSEFSRKLTEDIKSRWTNTVVVHGGVHSTVVPEDSLRSADYVIMHEGEITFNELVEKIKRKENTDNIKGIAYKKGNGIKINPQRSLIEDLDTLPRAAYDLLPVERYKMPLHVTGGDRLPIMGSRGCPYNCSFCTSPNLWQGRVRFRSAVKLVDEIQWLMQEYGVTNFHFWDDNFTLNPRFVEGFCNEIKGRSLKVKWIALDRAEHINKNARLLPGMKESGCVGIEIGLESANPDTFAHISKDQKMEDSQIAINNLRKNGIYPLYTCMAFNPGESIVGYYMQKEFLDKAQEGYRWHRFFHPFPYPVYIGQFATPYPKTAFWDNLNDQSMILVETPEDRFHHQINSIPFSLLEDRPVRTVDKLDEDLYMIFLNAAKLNLWAMFPGNDKPSDLGKKLYETLRFVRAFFKECDGKKTVKEVGKLLKEKTGMDYFKSMRLTAFATYIYSQVGAIRSAVKYKDYDIRLKRVKVPLATKLDIISLMRPFSVKRSDLND